MNAMLVVTSGGTTHSAAVVSPSASSVSRRRRGPGITDFDEQERGVVVVVGAQHVALDVGQVDCPGTATDAGQEPTGRRCHCSRVHTHGATFVLRIGDVARSSFSALGNGLVVTGE